MAKYVVWTNVTDKRTVEADTPQEATTRYHQALETLPDGWDKTFFVQDEQGEEEWTFRRAA
ncbi:MAG: hypothetical protein ACYC7E_15500 [Armatimonadota bacterium]